MYLSDAMQLLNTLLMKPNPSETDFGLMQSLSTYIEMQVRAANQLLELQLVAEGLQEYDPQGNNKTEH